MEMSTRKGRIAVSQEEKEALDDVAKDAFGDASVPYGVTISMLADQYFNHNEDN